MVKATYGTGCFLLMNTGDELVHSKNNLVTNVAWAIGDKVTYDLEGSAFNAGAVIKAIAPCVQGGGGGKPAMAQAGGKNAAGIDDALEAARKMLL